jgi:hypothetical protein
MINDFVQCPSLSASILEAIKWEPKILQKWSHTISGDTYQEYLSRFSFFFFFPATVSVCWRKNNHHHEYFSLTHSLLSFLSVLYNAGVCEKFGDENSNFFSSWWSPFVIPKWHSTWKLASEKGGRGREWAKKESENGFYDFLSRQ